MVWARLTDLTLRACPHRFAGQIKEFGCSGFVEKKMERRLDDTIKYIIVSGKNVSLFWSLLHFFV